MGERSTSTVIPNAVCRACAQAWRHRFGGPKPFLCPSCRAECGWCTPCDRALSLDHFYRGASGKPSSRCIRCRQRAQENLTCGRCARTFVRISRGGQRASVRKAVALCGPCEATHRNCAECATIKPLDQFAINRSKRGGRSYRCKPCYGAEWAATTSQQRFARAARKFGMSLEQAEALLASQGGRCAICRCEPAEHERFLAVDHDHATGRVRGYLCGPCNMGLGHFSDDPSILRKAADYLEKHALG